MIITRLPIFRLLISCSLAFVLLHGFLIQDIHLMLEHQHEPGFICDAGLGESHYHAVEHDEEGCLICHLNTSPSRPIAFVPLPHQAPTTLFSHNFSPTFSFSHTEQIAWPALRAPPAPSHCLL